MGERWRRACWFFAAAAWDVDDLGLAVARLIVKYLLGDGEPLVVAVDGTLFKRWGPKVFQARWAYDGSAQAGKRGRPRVKGDRLGTCAQVAASAPWTDTVINVYGHDTAVQITHVEGLWHGSFKTAPGRIVLVREPGSAKPY